MKIIDLSHPYQDGMPIYPGTPDVHIFPYHQEGWKCLGLNISTHAGTHIDAPSHLDPPGGKSIDQYRIGEFVGSGSVHQVLNPSENKAILPDDLNPAIELSPDEIPFLIIKTGWDQFWGEDKYYKHPYLSPELSTLIVECEYSLVGFDFINADSIQNPTGEAHRILFSAGIRIVENLTQLTLLDERKEYHFHFVPLMIPDGDGAPTRAYAVEVEG